MSRDLSLFLIFLFSLILAWGHEAVAANISVTVVWPSPPSDCKDGYLVPADSKRSGTYATLQFNFDDYSSAPYPSASIYFPGTEVNMNTGDQQHHGQIRVKAYSGSIVFACPITDVVGRTSTVYKRFGVSSSEINGLPNQNGDYHLGSLSLELY